ncbi:dTDP-4-dehydrorhamnose reductase [Caldivirga sp.]|uniref:dTDP-4-dehydrorhamnose reductase n=1 Tax=Caldivirga sp. TaxID=2080243 RepID=UPI003D0F6BAE
MILITGVSSLPGYKTAVKLASASLEVLGIYNQHPVSGVNAIKWDLLNDAVGLIRQYKPNVVIHMAAMGDVDGCEINTEQCYRLNVEVTRNVAKGAYAVGARLIYLSTDYVFDGSRGMYRESDAPRPINYYGLTKLLGEEAVLAMSGTVVRVAWIYGLGPGKPNFGKTVVEKLSRGEEVRAIVDQWGSPTLNTLIAEVMAKLLGREFEGILHAAGPRLSRFEFAKAIAEYFSFPTSLIKPIYMRDISYKAPRPRDSSLDSSLAVKMLGVPINDIKYALEILKREWETQAHATGLG